MRDENEKFRREWEKMRKETDNMRELIRLKDRQIEEQLEHDEKDRESIDKI
jgi:hypothetical protein